MAKLIEHTRSRLAVAHVTAPAHYGGLESVLALLANGSQSGGYRTERYFSDSARSQLERPMLRLELRDHLGERQNPKMHVEPVEVMLERVGRDVEARCDPVPDPFGARKHAVVHEHSGARAIQETRRAALHPERIEHLRARQANAESREFPLC